MKSESFARFLRHASCAAMACIASSALAQAIGTPLSCGPLEERRELPRYDYRVAPLTAKKLVEPYHFTPDVELLRRGNTSEGPGGDLNFTLNAFPNMPRALMSIVRYANLMPNGRLKPMARPLECYFDRAFQTAPDDPTPHLIYAIFLRDRKRIPEARIQLDEADRLRGDLLNFDFDYNLGLMYYDVGEYDKSAEAAKRAYALGAPFPSLKQKLQAKGKVIDN